MPEHTQGFLTRLAKEVFRVRSFKGATPDQLRRRFRLATGLIRDVAKGKITRSTAKLLAEEGFDRILGDIRRIQRVLGSSHRRRGGRRR